ncbi:hypothetical protein [Hyphobacterium sp.]|uniref:hypothetical protein n=1 Tax=Hyphobacterium sp. TaxID=2004662 RepID=UPI003B518D42
MKRLNLFAASVAATVSVAPAMAQDGGVIELSRDCEVELAYSAGTDHLRENAGVYAFGEDGYELVTPGSNGYVCMAVREAPNAVVPQCFDELAQGTHVRVFLDEGEALRAGEAFADIRARRAERFESGHYHPVDGHGVVYMMSDFNLVNASGNLLRVAPHVMFHAPGVSLDDVGTTTEVSLQNRGMPIVASPGPMGYLVSFVDHGTGTDRVMAACEGELPDLSTYAPFPPAGAGE